MKKRLHSFVFGVVQGVGYRYFAWKRANELGLSGFVKNLEDCSVEILAEGEEKTLKEFLELLEKGLSSAVIERITSDWSEPLNEFSGFSIDY